MSEIDFLKAIDELSKIQDKKIFQKQVKILTSEAVKKNSAYYSFRLACELDKRSMSVKKLEDHIIDLADSWYYNARFLIIFALNIKSANIEKIQNAVINTRQADLIAEFARIPKSNKYLLEQTVLALQVPKASYIFISENDTDNVEEHLKILIKSKKSKYLFRCIQLTDKKTDYDKYEAQILKNKTVSYIRMLASHPFANISKIEDQVISSGNCNEIKRIYKITKSDRLAKYILFM